MLRTSKGMFPNMTNREARDITSWPTKCRSSSDLQFYVRGVPFTLDRELLATKSAKVAAILQENPHEDISNFLRDIPANAETFEVVARFCHGFELQMSTENVIPLVCIAYYLEMTESHSRNNLLRQASTFFEQKVLPSWNETIKAIRVAEHFLQQAVDLGLVDACLESLIAKAITDPHLLGAPLTKNQTPDDNSEDVDDGYRPNARRRLFVLDWPSEDLTTLSLQLYEPIIRSMYQHEVPSEYVAASICEYAKRWVFSSTGADDDNMSIYDINSRREVIEAVEKLLPHAIGLLPCTILFEMLRYSITLEASSDCRNGFEIRIGKQLDQATVKDLLIPTKGYAKEVQYDTECLRRILKTFYGNNPCSDISRYVTVADLIEEYLAEVATDIDLKMDTFLSIADMSSATSSGIQRNLDGIYRAIDIYFDKHRHLTELEREEVCSVLDCQKMSMEACEHAAKNERLPLRVVVQVLFVAQLQLRGTINNEMQLSDDKLIVKEEVEAEEEAEDETKVGCGEEVTKEIKIMGNKVMELERECSMIRKEIDNTGSLNYRKGKISMWKQLKRKFGCITTVHDCNCQLKQTKKKKKKKVDPRFGV